MPLMKIEITWKCENCGTLFYFIDTAHSQCPKCSHDVVAVSNLSALINQRTPLNLSSSAPAQTSKEIRDMNFEEWWEKIRKEWAFPSCILNPIALAFVRMLAKEVYKIQAKVPNTNSSAGWPDAN